MRVARHCKTTLQSLDLTDPQPGSFYPLLTDRGILCLAEHCPGMTEFFWDWEYFSVGAVATLLGVCRLQQYGPNGRPESSPSDAVNLALASSPVDHAHVDRSHLKHPLTFGGSTSAHCDA